MKIRKHFAEYAGCFFYAEKVVPGADVWVAQG